MTRTQYAKGLSDLEAAIGSDRDKWVGHALAGHDLLVDCAPQCLVTLRWWQSTFRGL